MTDEELKELVAGLAVAQRATDRLLDRLAEGALKADQRPARTEELLDKLAERGDRRHPNTRRNEAYVVEIKSRLRPEDVDQTLNILDSFFDFFPEHRGKDLYAILAAVRVPEDLRTQVLASGNLPGADQR